MEGKMKEKLILTKEQKEGYASGWRERKIQKEIRLSEKRDIALRKTHQIGEMLKDNYKAEKVILFGSLAKGTFWEHSDIDLAVCGFNEDNYLTDQVSTFLKKMQEIANNIG